MTNDYRDIVVNLAIIANIQQGQKIYRQEDNTIGICSTSLLDKLWRHWHVKTGEGRNLSLNLLEEKINKAITYAEKQLRKIKKKPIKNVSEYLYDERYTSLNIICNLLKNAMPGIIAQYNTYLSESDISTSQKFMYLHDKINKSLRTLQRPIKDARKSIRKKQEKDIYEQVQEPEPARDSASSEDNFVD